MILPKNSVRLLADIDQVLIAVSGGVDSIALLHAVHLQSDTKIVAVHVDHQLREESASEGQFVLEFCKERHIQCVLERVIVNPDTSLQVTARIQRHAILRRCAARFGIKHILTAHHLDDYAETLMMNMGRGGGISSLAFGLEKTNSPFIYVRPFFDVSRQSIESFAETQNLKWCEDPSNRKDTYLRNRLRHNLADLREHYGDALKQSAVRIQDAANIVNTSIKLLWEKNYHSSGPFHVSFRLENLQSDIPLLREFLRHLSTSFFGETLSETNIEQSVSLILSGKQTSLSLHGIQIEYSALLTFRKNFGRGNRWWSDLNQKCVLELEPERSEYTWFDWNITLLPTGTLASIFTEGAKIEIRNWERGMKREGKSLSKIVKTHTRNRRWRIPCLVVENEIQWILGDRIDSKRSPDRCYGMLWEKRDGPTFEI